MKTFLAILISILLTNTQIFSQKSSIEGSILDKSNSPLVGVNVILKGTVRGVETNANGAYTIKGLKSGSYVVTASLMGFKTEEIKVELSENQNKVVNFKLQETSFTMNEVHVVAARGIRGNEHLAEIEGFSINAGKKNELIKIENLNANLAMNNSRQIFSKTPGITIWENDGSGVQLGVASRGLSPNRSWEFNNRMNGYDITPDPMGYPEAYYTPPMEVVSEIQLVRGASSLQYGSQFGGLMNFILRKPDISTRFTIESQNTTGSNGLFSTFNYVGGTEGRISYTAYYQKRLGQGWRENSAFNTDHAHAEVSFAVNNKLKIGLESTYMTTEIQQAGGLTDVLFKADARQSKRVRNWFSTPWFIANLNIDYILSPNVKLNWKTFSTVAQRKSIGNISAINTEEVKGSIRQLDIDAYQTLGSEIRLLADYELGSLKNTVATGLRYFNGKIDRNQLGKGTSGSDADFSLVTDYTRKLDFENTNLAAFVENIFRPHKRVLVTAGLRSEYINSSMQGQLTGTSFINNPIKRNRQFFIFGLGADYHPTPLSEVYTNISQAYRPVLISDLTPPATTDSIDANLSDASGFNFDLGYRGKIANYLNFDFDVFYLSYNNRIGTISQEKPNATKYQFRTNLGNSVSKGTEIYLEFDPVTAFLKKSKFGYISMFTSLAFIDAKYVDFKTTSIANGKIVEGNLATKNVENAPRTINRFGLKYSKRDFSLTWQLSAVGQAFADASNTISPNSTATSGIIPAYKVQDIAFSFRFKKNYNIKGGINNLSDARYFTRRAGGYPGPGLMPADGRTFFISAGFKY